MRDQYQPMFVPFGENVLLSCYIMWQLFLWCWLEFFLSVWISNLGLGAINGSSCGCLSVGCCKLHFFNK
jgi:hypothetical protein